MSFPFPGLICQACSGKGTLSCNACLCRECRGKGQIQCDHCVAGKIRCPECKGSQKIVITKKWLVFSRRIDQKCCACSGGKQKCASCRGTYRLQCSGCAGLRYLETCSQCAGTRQIKCAKCYGAGRFTKELVTTMSKKGISLFDQIIDYILVAQNRGTLARPRASVREAILLPSLHESQVLAKGKSFEAQVSILLQTVAQVFPSRVTLTPQAEVKLNDSRKKVIDFAFDYRSLSSNHQIAIECQDRASWSSEIVDKILAIRNHSFRNRFWFVYNDPEFLTRETKKLLKSHGIIFFSFLELENHLAFVALDLWGAEQVERALANVEPIDLGIKNAGYKPPSDSAMLSR